MEHDEIHRKNNNWDFGNLRKGSKTTKKNRQLRGETGVSNSDKKRIKSLISDML